MKTLLILLSTLVLGAGQGPGKKLYLRKQGGQAIAGTLLSLDGDVVKLRVQLLGGTAVSTHHLSDFEPASAWRIGVAADPPKDFAGHLRAAKAAAAASLLWSLAWAVAGPWYSLLQAMQAELSGLHSQRAT